MEKQQHYEQLGLFYLGRELEMSRMEASSSPLLFRNRDLTTHGVIIGMTGSGKTGLGIGLIEEAIMDNIPSIIIDPKGDMANLLLTFPELAPDDFKPWIDPAEAASRDMTIDEYARKTARVWKTGLAGWDQEPQRIKALRDKTTMTVYTPGSSAGVPVSVLSSLGAPASEILQETDTITGLVSSTASSLLGLIGVDGDPMQSREHVLISSILLQNWQAGSSLTMESLIGAIASPPFERVGVFPLNTYYPQSERMKLAMRLNNLLASPGFAAWLQGTPLDIQNILYGEDGQPRTAIFSIAHLSEQERMFFVTLLLNRFVGWMRRQQGASTLKVLLYMDEIFGYFPPVANPPTKKPMLLLLKQARAFGCGVVLATQNPVDLDYKGLSNIGTWFVGRLQTRQDREKVADGIAGAGGGSLSSQQVDMLLSSLKGRQFLLNSAHIRQALLFETRWVMSYLKGPVSNQDIARMMADQKAQHKASEEDSIQGEGIRATDDRSSVAPILSEGIDQFYRLLYPGVEPIVLTPWLLAWAKVRYFNAKRGLDLVETVSYRLSLSPGQRTIDWAEAESASFTLSDCLPSPPDQCSYSPLPAAFSANKDLDGYARAVSEYLYQSRRMELFRCTALKLESQPGESLGEFKVKMLDCLREKRELAIEKVRNRYDTRQQRLNERLLKARVRLEKEEMDVRSRTADSFLSIGAAVVGALFGRKVITSGTVSRAATGMRSAGKVMREKEELRLAREEVERLAKELETLGMEIAAEMETLSASFEPAGYQIESFFIKPRRSDIFDLHLALVWETLQV